MAAPFSVKEPEFAKAMKARDPSIQMIGWGDMERDTGKWWANELVQEGGDLVDMVAIHMMHQNPGNDPDDAPPAQGSSNPGPQD